MGQYDSSRTRVAPVFHTLRQNDPSGRSWLPRLLALGSLAGQAGDLTSVGELPESHPDWWGRKERRLPAPKSLLTWLVRNATAPSNPKLWGSDGVKSKRQRLVHGDEGTISEALTLLAQKPRRRAWYVLEGESCPDACIQTDKILLVVEGKRTEREATTVTTWMPRRSQMLRHMDAAWEVREGRRVLGLMIVEGAGGAEVVEPSDYWNREAEREISPRVLEESLPHRNEAERAAIAGGFLGVTTWQQVCREFGLRWPPVKEAPRGTTKT